MYHIQPSVKIYYVLKIKHFSKFFRIYVSVVKKVYSRHIFHNKQSLLEEGREVLNKSTINLFNDSTLHTICFQLVEKLFNLFMFNKIYCIYVVKKANSLIYHIQSSV